MIRLNPHREPTWFELLPGLRVKVAPLTTALMVAARKDMAVRAAIGNDAETEVAVGKALASLTILEWDGVGDENGEAVPVTPENVGHLLDIWPVWLAWSAKVLSTIVQMDAEKNGFAPLPSGTSAGAGNTAEPAEKPAETAPAS